MYKKDTKMKNYIENISELLKTLDQITETAKPLFGKMSAQHMIEHLSFALMFSNGKLPQKLYLSEEKANYAKQNLLNSDLEFPKGYKAPMLGEELLDLKFPSFETAKTKLLTEIDDFKDYFEQNKEKKIMSPVFGELNQEEWIRFHNKHFTHHFKQFGVE